MAAAVGDPPAQDIDGAVLGDLGTDAFEQRGAVLAAGVLLPELFPGLRLRRPQEFDEDVLVDAEGAVEVLGRTLAVALGEQGFFDGGFEVLLGGVDDVDPVGMSVCAWSIPPAALLPFEPEVSVYALRRSKRFEIER